MATWITVVVAAVVALLALIAAVLVARPRAPRAPVRPAWAVPDGRLLRETRFALTRRGYDPAQVDTVLTAAGDALDALADEAGPEGCARAEDRIRTARAMEVRSTSMRRSRRTDVPPSRGGTEAARDGF